MREKTILIVDDERRMADSLRDLLASAGYQAQAAYGGLEALERLRRESFHVLVTDLRMGEMDGLSLIREINERYPRMLIIVITGYASTESAVEAVHYQVFDYLRKPFDFELFQKTMEKAFQKIETEQLREDTAAMITHDIKIPLTSIIGFASMIYDRNREEFHPRARDFCEAIQANGQKILALIENYLTTCKIEAGTFKILPTSVDPRQLVHDIVETYAIEAHRRGRTIEHELYNLPHTVDVDEPMIFRAVSNLLGNAIKHGSPAGPILLRAGIINAPQTAAPVLCIEVINPTDVIVPLELTQVFQRYQRPAVRPGVEGCGLGLYVVRAIAEAHGGEVCAELLPGNKVRFALSIPLPASMTPPTAPAGPDSGANAEAPVHEAAHPPQGEPPRP